MAIIGIDLGTTNSACGIWANGELSLIKNRLGDTLTPSVVGLDDTGEVIVGRRAKERLISHSDLTVAVFKRLMGSNHKVKLGKKEFSAIELSALILKALKEDAEAHLNATVDAAVISVPAYFNDNQRHATKLAGELAGLEVNRLINEPTAAAVAYGLHEKQEGTFLVLDMGGGTFDVSILEFFDGIMEVHASAGDNFLGGEDFVTAMVNDFLQQQEVKSSTLNKAQLNSLYMQMETIKRRVDVLDGTPFSFNLGKHTVEWTPTADWFQKISTPLLLRAKIPIERAMRDAKTRADDIDDIILVGGATRMKLFRNTIGRMFGRFPSANIDPDTVVAQGAAVQAGLVAKDAALDDVVLTDVCPYTLGTAIHNSNTKEAGYFFPIIERNAVVPISIVKRLYTAEDNQTSVNVRVYQGENRTVDKNIFLGDLDVKVPKKKAGEEAIDVRYSYDMNGLLEIDVEVVSTGEKVNKVIHNAPGSLSEEEIGKCREKLAQLKFHPRDQEENKALVAKGERLYESFIGEQREWIAQILKAFDAVLERQNPIEIQQERKKLSQILDDLDNEDWL
ncbi:molecular chaperone HscC [Marinibactrum halimedae]|uniref:Molecular chaperone HscC n=1 Tax=Marinibactrum halimedae TaxID=1444977 RepID=A0AA37WMQ8_9GAMM|nr:molecular chaperone HscC [Marinibactrum halimedae]MCD9458535.1 molecular chaperone HscC [Marinibactrum halimedae]GLS26600.1 molecular chaperone HscC [Marinibactrum halimedae]